MTLRGWLKYWLYGSCPGFAGAFRYFGTRVFFPRGSHIFAKACASDVYEKANAKLLAALVRPDTTFIDIGANIGLLSIPILRSLPTCRVISFEPSPNTLPFLSRTKAGSDFGDRWEVVGKAVGRESGTLEFFTHAPELGAFDGLRGTDRAGAATRQTVPVTTLDEHWTAAEKPTVSVIKIDVEGAELEVLRGAENCLSTHRPSILLEWSAENLGAFQNPPEALLIWAREARYRLLSLPDFSPIEHPADLSLKMLSIESFLLIPDPAGPDWQVHHGSFPGLRD